MRVRQRMELSLIRCARYKCYLLLLLLYVWDLELGTILEDGTSPLTLVPGPLPALLELLSGALEDGTSPLTLVPGPLPALLELLSGALEDGTSPLTLVPGPLPALLELLSGEGWGGGWRGGWRGGSG